MSRCTTRQTFTPEPRLTYELPSRPWEKIGADLFELNGQSYIIMIDYWSNYFEVADMHKKTSLSVIYQCKAQFARHGIPSILATDFPIPNYLVEPDGYLFLHSKSQIPVMIKDKLGKNVLEVPATGPMWIHNTCAKNTSTHCASHIKDIRKILAAHPELKRTVFAAITDGWYVSTGQSRTQPIFHGSSWRNERSSTWSFVFVSWLGCRGSTQSNMCGYSFTATNSRPFIHLP